MGSRKTYYGGENPTYVDINPTGAAPKIKNMRPGDMYTPHKAPILDPIELMGLPSQSKAVHHRDEDHEPLAYCKGGKVIKSERY